jgi:uncharacterized protein with GYD domain
MASYLIQVGYTPEAWAKMIKNPQDRGASVSKAIEKLGGKMISLWFCFGEYDAVGILEMPGNVEAAAFSLAASAGGAVRALKTTPLLSVAEGMDAMKKAAGSGYKPPK